MLQGTLSSVNTKRGAPKEMLVARSVNVNAQACPCFEFHFLVLVCICMLLHLAGRPHEAETQPFVFVLETMSDPRNFVAHAQAVTAGTLPAPAPLWGPPPPVPSRLPSAQPSETGVLTLLSSTQPGILY